jgi:hypothetical protein
MKSAAELRRLARGSVVHAAGAIRRMAIKATAGVLWKLEGFRLPDGSTESPEVEVFGGVGFYARPPSSGKPEAIVLLVGDDATAPVVVAIRDEKTRAAIVGSLGEGETAMYTSDTVVHLKNGAVHLGSSNAVDAVVKGTTYRAAEDAYFSALEAMIATICAEPTMAAYLAIGAPATVLAAWTTAIATFHAAAANYLATKAKVI